MTTPISHAAPEQPHSDPRKISIRGLPVFAGALLSGDSPVFASLRTMSDFIAFAKKLRGQFSIVIEDASATVAITDFGCSRPVFYVPDSNSPTRFRVGSRLPDLLPVSRSTVSREALFLLRFPERHRD